MPPISGEGKVGDLLSTISTQPRTNTVERRVKRCAVLASMAWPVCVARHLANFLHIGAVDCYAVLWAPIQAPIRSMAPYRCLYRRQYSPIKPCGSLVVPI